MGGIAVRVVVWLLGALAVVLAGFSLAGPAQAAPTGSHRLRHHLESREHLGGFLGQQPGAIAPVGVDRDL